MQDVGTAESKSTTGRFGGKVVLIAGGGAGIGRRFAQRFADEGASVAIGDIDLDAAQRVVGEVQERSMAGLACQMDVTNVEQVSDAVAQTVDAFGGVDILVSCAAIHLDHAQLPFDLESIPQWRKVMDVNVIGALVCAAACRPALAERGGGSIINLSSMAAYGAAGAYAVSKLALNSLTVGLAANYGDDGIRVNGIAPGLVNSESAMEWAQNSQHAGGVDVYKRLIASQIIKRQGLTDDLANMCLFLCSAEASFVTGQTILVDGGYTKKPY